MTWLESHQSLREHPKLKRLCRTLKLKRPMAIGHLQLLWWWVLEYRMDGVLTDLNDAEIAEASEYERDPKKFVSALIDAKFIDRRDGVLTVHDWFDYCGEVVRKRLQRLSDKRSKTADIGGQNPPTQPHPTKPNPTVPVVDQPLGSGVDFKEVLSSLLSLGFRKATAMAYISTYGVDRIKRVCDQAKRANNPMGWIIKALEQNWEV